MAGDAKLASFARISSKVFHLTASWALLRSGNPSKASKGFIATRLLIVELARIRIGGSGIQSKILLQLGLLCTIGSFRFMCRGDLMSFLDHLMLL